MSSSDRHLRIRRHFAYYAVYLLSTLSISLQRSTSSTHISTSITEGLPPGSPLIDLWQHVVAPSDRHHSSLNTQPTFSVGQHQNLFSVIGTVLTTASAIDRESLCPHDPICLLRLDIGVESAGTFEVIKVEITVLDLNDNSPTFRQSSLNLSFPESNPSGTLLQIPPAYDLDSSHNNSEISYRLESGETPFRLALQKDSNGSHTTDLRLELTGSLDREERSHYDLEVLAVDGGHPPRTGTLQIAIEVTDLNDNSPRFDDSSYEVSIDRNVPAGTVVATVHASDPDEGPNGQVRYHLARRTQVLYGRLFSVDAMTGEVKTKSHLDSGLHTFYHLFVIAEDLGENPTPTVANLVVHLRGSNDHPPQISVRALSGEASSAHLQENSLPGSFVAHVTIHDPDVGRDGQTECQLNSDNFSLVALRDKEYKLVAVNSFDREERDEYQVVVRCWDLGEEPLTSSLNLSIIITDEDDNAPIFSRSTYEVSVPENNEKNSFLLQVHATDADSGPNTRLMFSLDPDAENWFRVDPESGIITSLISFDREFVDQFDFHVVARSAIWEESGREIHSGHVARSRVHVTVTDVDDEPPRFSQSWYKFEVAENENSGKVVGQVTAVDEDFAPFNSFSYHLEYSPEDGSSSNHFAVDPVSGVIYTRQTLDREALSHYTLRIRAQGDVNAALSDVTVVFIRVSDVNDNAPVFKFPAADDDVIRLHRNLSGGGGGVDGDPVVATIRAFDRDLDRNADLTYSILSGNENKAFLLDPKSGRLSWNSDSAPSYQANCFTNLIIQVKDGGQPNPLQTTTQVRLVCDDHFVYQSDGYGGGGGGGGDGGGGAGGEDRVRGLSGVHFLILASVLACCIVVVIVLLAAICVTRDQTRALKRRDRCNQSSSDSKGTRKAANGGGQGSAVAATGVKQDSDLVMLDRQKVSLDDGETIVLALHHFDLLRIAQLSEQVSK